ncbi:hypothetical protein [Mycolicibacterium bacteremicum]|uniref:PE-PPE domain-containing protein n=1 Tax=Mycolicibacterium bacteremicum TaxID=564198 RepID=A0A1W9Z1D5_MYCBA|nr:hypothetical protein [Mycolicibacterium bacteremicum]MCV7432325.1 hypothetical protein [Mycolicibacterium bacteremicum]ORA06077.1 hypothetical protein BST17_07015 [Mycolicibacterium bacteremicum]
MANKVFRQTLSTGVALAGAGAIALTPITVSPEATAVLEAPRVLSAEVVPAGLVQDLQLVAAGAQAALGQSYDALTRKIPELWWTVHEQWPDADLLHWNYALVSDIFLAPITPLVIGPLNDAVAEAVARNFPVLGEQIRQIPELVEYAFVRLVGPLLSAIGGAGVAHSEIFYSMTTLRIEPFIEAIVRAPFHVIDGLLFGGYGDLGPILPGREGEYIPAPGLLTPWGQPPAVRDIKTPNDIADSTVPDASATVVSLVTDTGEQAQDLHAAPAAVPAPEVVDEPEVVEADVADDEVVEADVADDEVVEDEIAEEKAVETEVVEEKTTESETAEEKAAEMTSTESAADPEAVTKPAKKDPAAGIRQGFKDFRDNVGRTVQKLTGGGAPARSDARDSGADSRSSQSGQKQSGE